MKCPCVSVLALSPIGKYPYVSVLALYPTGKCPCVFVLPFCTIVAVSLCFCTGIIYYCEVPLCFRTGLLYHCKVSLYFRTGILYYCEVSLRFCIGILLRPRATVRSCRTTASDPTGFYSSRQSLTSPSEARCLVSDENSACQILIRHNTLCDGDVKICRTTTPGSGSVSLAKGGRGMFTIGDDLDTCCSRR